MRDFTTRYMDPTEVYARFDQLAAEFSDIAELITLPNKTNGYRRKAQATGNLKVDSIWFSGDRQPKGCLYT